MFDDRVKPGLLSADCLHLSRWWWWRWGWWDIQAMTSILANNVEISKTLCCAEGQTRSLAGICGTTCCSHGLTNRSHRNTNKCQNTNTYATQTGLTKTQTCIKNTHKHKQVFQKGKGSQLCLKIATVCRLGQSFMVIYIQARRYIYFPCPMLTLLKKLFLHVFPELYSFTRWTTMTWRPSSARPKSGRSCQPKSIVEQFFSKIYSVEIFSCQYLYEYRFFDHR